MSSRTKGLTIIIHPGSHTFIFQRNWEEHPGFKWWARISSDNAEHIQHIIARQMPQVRHKSDSVEDQWELHDEDITEILELMVKDPQLSFLNIKLPKECPEPVDMIINIY